MVGIPASIYEGVMTMDAVERRDAGITGMTESIYVSQPPLCTLPSEDHSLMAIHNVSREARHTNHARSKLYTIKSPNMAQGLIT